MPDGFNRFNLILRALMELGYWGFRTGDSIGMKILLGIGAPLLIFGFWGLVDFHQAGSLSEALRLVQELVISGLAALAWYTAGAPVLGWALALVSIIHHALVYLLGERLVKG